MVVSVLLAATLSAPTIDFEVRATTLTNALGKLSRITGKTYRAEERMAAEIVCIKANRITPEDLAAKIAEATDCEWRDTNGTQVLFRSAVKDQEFTQAEIAANERNLAKLFKPKREELSKKATAYDQAQGFLKALKALEDKMAENPRGINLDGPRLAAPSSLLVTQLALDIGESTLAALPPEQTIVFSNHPTVAQRPFGPNADAYIRRFQDAEQHLKTLLPEDRPKGVASGLLDDIYESVGLGDSVGKVLMTVSRRGRSMFFGLTVYTPEGKTKCWGFNSTHNLGDDYYAREQAAGAGQEPKWVTLSPASKLYADYAEKQPDISSFEGAETHPWTSMPPTAQKLFQNPEELDPLSFAVTDGCFALADAKATPMVAYLSDSQERATRAAIKDGKLNLTRFEALLKETGLRQQQSDGWLMMKSGYPNNTRRYRLSRPALGRFMRATVAAGAIDLYNYGRFNFEAGMPIQYSSIGRSYRKTLTNYGIGNLPDIESHGYQSFAVLGSFAPGQWQSLLRGTEFRVGQGVAGQRGAATELMKELGAAEVVSSPDIPDLLKGWTEFSPRGLPRDAAIRIESKSVLAIRNYVKIRQPDGSTKEGFMDMGIGNTPAQMASAYAKGGYYRSLDQALTEMKKARYQIFERSEITMWVGLLPSHTLKERFLSSPSNPRIVSYDGWPQAAKEEFESTFRRDFKPRSGG